MSETQGANVAGIASLQGNSGAEAAENKTSSIVPGDEYASGGPKAPEVDPDGVDFDEFDFEKPEMLEAPTKKEPVTETEEVPEDVKKEQSPEANAAFAELRRQAEQAQRALNDRDAWVRQNFGATHGITTWEQYQAAVENTHRQQQIARQQEMQNRPQQVYQETYQRLINEGHDEAMAREIADARKETVAQGLQSQLLRSEIEAMRRQEQQRREAMERQQQQAMQEQLTQAILDDHKKLTKEYGDLVPALNGMDKNTLDKLNKGYTLYDAWFLSNRDKVTAKLQKAEAQKTINRINSKAHLKTEGDGVGDNVASIVPLPPDTLQMYMDGGMTEKQARAFHKKLYG